MDDRSTQDLENSIDLDRFRLRTFIDSLRGTDQLDVREESVDLADMAAIMHGNAKAVWFKKAGPEGVEVVGNVVGGGASALPARLASTRQPLSRNCCGA